MTTSFSAANGQDNGGPWPLWRRWLLNFGTLYLLLYFLVFGQRLLPVFPQAWLYLLGDSVHNLVFGRHLPPLQATGSGDTALDWTLTLSNVVLSVVLATIWTFWKRHGHPATQVNVLRSVLRFFLLAWLMVYGLPKFGFMQFGLLRSEQLTQTYGESSPMGLLWRFMAASPGYQWLAGVAEVLPAVLLLHRRTVTLGAAVAAITMSNVFALNLFYDVPVKLFSGHLLLSALVLLGMDAPRLWAFVQGRAVAPLDLPPASPVSRWGAWVLTALCVVGVAFSAWQGTQLMAQQPAPGSSSQELLRSRGFNLVNEKPFNR